MLLPTRSTQAARSRAGKISSPPATKVASLPLPSCWDRGVGWACQGASVPVERGMSQLHTFVSNGINTIDGLKGLYQYRSRDSEFTSIVLLVLYNWPLSQSAGGVAGPQDEPARDAVASCDVLL